MKINIRSIFKRNKILICLSILLFAFNTFSFSAINYSAATFPSNDLYSLFSPGFKDAKKRGQNAVFGSVSFKNTGTNYSLNKSIPYDDCFVLENTYSKESNLTFLVINGNQQIQPCLIKNEVDSFDEYPVFSVCMNDYFDIDYVGSHLSFTNLNSVLIPDSLANKIGLIGDLSGKKLEMFSKRNNEVTKKELTICGIYQENNKSMFMKNIAGQFPIIVSRNTTIPGTPSLYFRAPTDSYLYYNVYAKKVYNSIAVDWYEKDGKYGTRVIEFYNNEFDGKKITINETVSKRANFIEKESRFVFLATSLLSFILLSISSVLVLARIRKQKINNGKIFYLLATISAIFPLIIFSIINSFIDSFPFGSNLQLLNGVGILIYMLFHVSMILFFAIKAKRGENEKNIIN